MHYFSMVLHEMALPGAVERTHTESHRNRVTESRLAFSGILGHSPSGKSELGSMAADAD